MAWKNNLSTYGALLAMGHLAQNMYEGCALSPPWPEYGPNGPSGATWLLMTILQRAVELIHAQPCANRFVLRE
jgi:hypothetical protein